MTKLITAHGRGVIAGSVEAPHFMQDHLRDDEIRFLAARVHEAMQEAGFAHIEPESEFVDGFVEGFKTRLVPHL